VKSRARELFDQKVNAEINVTNLVDVMLVLLIIFILIAPVIEQGISVDLPKISDQKMKLPESVTVSIGKAGEIFLGKELVSLEELKARLSEVAQQAPETSVIVRADKEIQYDAVVQVLDQVRSAGLTKLGMATQIK
jgi:biopolymer transport protein ExbD